MFVRIPAVSVIFPAEYKVEASFVMEVDVILRVPSLLIKLLLEFVRFVDVISRLFLP